MAKEKERRKGKDMKKAGEPGQNEEKEREEETFAKEK